MSRTASPSRRSRSRRTINPLSQPGPTGHRAAAPTKIDEIFEAVDVDSSGVLGYHEFCIWYKRHVQLVGGDPDPEVEASLLHDIRETFDVHDRNGNGELDRKEFATVLVTVATRDWKECFDQARDRAFWFNCKTKASRWIPPDVQEVDKYLVNHRMWPTTVEKREAGELANIFKRKAKTAKMFSKLGNDAHHNVKSKNHRETLNMWKVALLHRKREQQALLSDAALFLLYYMLLVCAAPQPIVCCRSVRRPHSVGARCFDCFGCAIAGTLFAPASPSRRRFCNTRKD